MGETVSNEKAAKKVVKNSFIKNLKVEFKKIIWPDKATLTKQTASVLVMSVVLGAIVAVLDLIIKFGLNIIIG